MRRRRITAGVIAGATCLTIALAGCTNDTPTESSPSTTTVRPTFPPGTNLDDAYLIGVDQIGLRGVGFSDQDLVTAANQICGSLRGGASAPEVLSRLNAGFSGQLSQLQLSQLLGLTVSTYCSEQGDRVRGELGG